MHPAAKRSWLQTGGLPVEPVHADLRAEFDRVHDVVYIGGGCFRLRDRAGVQVGLVQFQGEAQSRTDAAVMATTERLATGEAKPVDIAAGDTLIRPLDMRDPVDRTLAENAIGRADASVIIPDAERQDPPPIDLPDYHPADECQACREEIAGLTILGEEHHTCAGGQMRDGKWLGIAIMLLIAVAIAALAFCSGRG